MIGWGEIYKVIVAMVPLYVALILGYGSIRWWRIFSSEQSDAINRLVYYFTLPLFTFGFTANIDPLAMNYSCIAADAISKVIIVAVIGIWAKFSSKGSCSWSITSFSLSTLTSSLVVGVPLLRAMYGDLGVSLVVQLSVVQAVVWLMVLLFVLELRRSTSTTIGTLTADANETRAVVDGADDNSSNVSLTESVGDDLEGNEQSLGDDDDDEVRPRFCSVMKVVWLKLCHNPNSYACVVGLTWAFVSNRWHLTTPSIVQGSLDIMANAGTGTAMFSMGMFMASQEKIIACGTSLTAFGMVLRFIADPGAIAIGALAMGLRGDVLRIVIIQAALPQSITSFVYAKEYGLHARVLSTAVIFGMLVSLPVLIAYYAGLEMLH